MSSDNTNNWLTSIEEFNQSRLKDLNDDKINKRNGNLLYLDEIRPGQDIVLKKFIGIRERPYGSKYFCIDYFDKEDKLKRIAFQAESTVGKQLSHEILNTISGSCSPGNDEYSEILIKRLNGTSIYIISWNQGNYYVRLSGDCRNNTGLSRVDEIIDKILDNKRNDDNIEMVTKDDIVFVKKNKALEAIIGKGEDNSVSEAEKEEIWRRYSEKKYYANEDIEDAGDEKVLEELEKLFHRSVQTLGDVIDERRIYHNADPEGSTELYDYISSVIYKINEPAPSASFLCAAHNFEKENNGACQSYSYEGNTWTHKIVEQDSFYELSALKLPIDQTDICNIFEELPDEIQKYINGTQFLVECNTNVWFHSIGRKTDTTFSAFFLVASKNKEIIDCFRANSNRLYDYIVYLQTVNQIERDKQINKKSSELAATAIMSRNMSHNLGSHVISYVKQSLSSVDNMFKDKVLAQLSKDETEGNQSLPFLLGLGHFFSYLQERQDFIATIATDYFPHYSTINFKDHIYDELNPDKRYQRHSERQELEIDNILLGNIAQSEGLGRSISPTRNTHLADIVLKFRAFNGDTPNSGSDAEKSLEEMRRYDLSIPGGVVGRQAIFSIVENVIRNAAKHGNWREAEKLELTFDIYDFHDIDSGRVSADDNVDDKSLSLQEVLQKYYFSAKDKYDNYVITLTDNLSVSKESLGNLRRALSEKYIDPLTGTINNGNKGLKEMRISSAWLRAIDEGNSEFTLSYLSERNEFLNDEGFQNDKNWYYKADDTKNRLAPLVYARISKSDEGTQRLQYIFCVPIPKKVAVVSDEIFENGEESKLLKHGWRLYSSDVFLNKDTDKSFEFIIFDDIFYDQIVKGEDLYNRIRQKTSSRLIRLSELPPLNDLITQIKEGTLKYDEAYQAFYEHIAKCQENDRIAIQDSKATARHEGSLQSVANPSGGSYLSAADGKVSISDGVKVEPYIYRTHHDSKFEFLNFIENSAQGGIFQNFKYVEGISGNNSTDRFVRNETIDDIWFFKHLHAMKTKVAIFDERIFSKVFGLKESDFYREIVATTDNIKEIKVYLEQEYPDDLYDYSFLDTPDELNQYLASKNLSSECDSETDNYIAKTFEQKNVFVYNLIRSKDNPSVYHLIGLKDFKKKEAGFLCCCGRLASFSWDKEKEELIIDSTAELRGQFDKISIHQGLLDKLYTAFGIRNHDNEAALKEKLTYYFYQFFSRRKGEDAIEISHISPEYNSWFLPGMAIHSGRSKPGEKDMPQMLPFIQYSSIEHAVFDCKLSLVELLDFARYE